MTRGAAGAVSGDPDDASTFGGAGDGTRGDQLDAVDHTVLHHRGVDARPPPPPAARSSATAAPTPATARATTATSTWTTTVTSSSASTPVACRTVSSAGTYNDGSCHHIVATLSATTGMALYVDGKRVASDAGTTSAQAYTGYWRIGGDNLRRLAQPALEQLLQRHHRRRRHLPVGAEPRAGAAALHRLGSHAGRGPEARPTPTARPSTTRARTSTGAWVRPAAPRRRDSGPNGMDGGYFGGTTLGQPGGIAGTSDTAVGLRRRRTADPSSQRGGQPDRLLRGAVVQDHDHPRGQADRLRQPADRPEQCSYDRHVYMDDSGRLTLRDLDRSGEHGHLAGRLQRRRLAPRGGLAGRRRHGAVRRRGAGRHRPADAGAAVHRLLARGWRLLLGRQQRLVRRAPSTRSRSTAGC